MGSPVAELGRDEWERQFKASVSQGFWLAKFQLTIAQWIAILPDSQKFLSEALNHPANNISWHEAHSFCELLNSKLSQSVTLPEGYRFSLPTSMQWEFACRAGTQSTFFFGNDFKQLDDYAWYKANSEGSAHCVGGKLPNPWGIFDMHGNVFEWCLDGPDGYALTPGGRSGLANSGNDVKTARGGGFKASYYDLRCAARPDFNPNDRYEDWGLRIAIAPN